MTDRAPFEIEAFFSRIDFSEDPAYKDAVAWYHALESDPKLKLPEGDDFALQFAEDRFKELADAKSAIEEKADALLKMAGQLGVAAVAGLVALKKGDGIGTIGYWAAPSLVFLSLAAAMCVHIRRPCSWPAPFDPRFTLDRLKMSENPERTRAIAVASAHCAVVGARYVVRQLARRLNAANHVALVSLILLWLLAFAR